MIDPIQAGLVAGALLLVALCTLWVSGLAPRWTARSRLAAVVATLNAVVLVVLVRTLTAWWMIPTAVWVLPVALLAASCVGVCLRWSQLPAVKPGRGMSARIAVAAVDALLATTLIVVSLA